MSPRAAMSRLCAVAVLVAVSGCGVPDQSRWERGQAVTAGNLSAEPDQDASAFATVEVGPVVAAIEARGEVRVSDPTVVLADRTGRLESRTTAVGDVADAGDVVLEFSSAPDPTDELRIDILEIEREIADLEGAVDEVARLDVEIDDAISAVRGGSSVDLASVVAPTTGVISEYFVSVFDVVRAGDELFSIGDPANRAVVLTLPASRFGDTGDIEAPTVGSPVSLVDPRSPLGAAVSATVASVIPTFDEVGAENAADSTSDNKQAAHWVVVIELDPASSFEVGDDVTVVFESATAPASLRLDADAVRGVGDAAYVIVDGPSGAWRRVDVRIGARTDDHVQIAESAPALAEGDRVLLP